MIKNSFVFILAFVFVQAQAQQLPYSVQKQVTATRGAVVSAHPLASQAGLEILKLGGNAMDAAIATQLVLAVVYPNAGNLGGGGYTVASFANGKKIAIDYRERAPAKAHKDMYLDAEGNPIKNLSLNGALASGVPGTVAGVFKCYAYAKLSFARLIAPAIRLAENGFPLTKAQAASLNANRKEFLQYNTKPIPFVKDSLWKEGDILIQKDLAGTLKRIRDKQVKGFYEGFTAHLVEAQMKNSGGIITRADMKNYKATQRIPLSFNYQGMEILSMPLSSSGGIMLQQMMLMAKYAGIDSMKFQSPEALQVMIEAERRTFADRAYYLGDEDFVKVPVKEITSESYLRQRINDFVPGKAGTSFASEHGVIKQKEQTTHLNVIDRWGNVVSLTTTLNDNYGSKLVVQGAGFFMNNEMDDFSIKPGVPNMYGAIGNEANAIASNKRMLSCMTPTIVLKNGKPFIVTGTPGGTTIPTSVFQTLLNVIVFKLSPADAVNLPKFHHQWLPDIVDVERDFDAGKIKILEAMGYTVKPRGSIGRTELIVIEKSGSITAIADKRGDDDARGY